MAHAVDGNSEIGANVRSNLCDLISLRHSVRSRAITNCFFSPKGLFSFMSAHHVLSYHLIQVPCFQIKIEKYYIPIYETFVRMPSFHFVEDQTIQVK